MKKTTIPVMLTILLITLNMTLTNGQGKSDYKVAIFLYEGAELLDFSGPGEVFGATSGFTVYTISVDGKDILSQGFVTVKPEYSIENAPQPDIVVYPGGATRKSSENPKVISWVKKTYENGATQLSVCTGATILAKAGLLEGLKLTTWYGAIDRLQSILPNSTVLKDTRFVDNGTIMTTAGVSAGIDGALHLVERIKGKDIAAATAKYMEYDKWDPESGLVTYENSFLKSLVTSGPESKWNTSGAFTTDGRPNFFEGELKNLGLEYSQKNEWEKAAKVFELVTKAYPTSVKSFDNLSQAYKQLGKFAPLSEEEFMSKVMHDQVDEAIAAFREARSKYPGWMMFREQYLNAVGYSIMNKKDITGAIKLFQLNAEVYPESANVFDSLGEAYLNSGDKASALASYKKALEIDPESDNARKMIKEITK